MSKPDTAERILDAQVNSDPAPDYLLAELDPAMETDVGSVPMHLRHLWVFVDTLEQTYAEYEQKWKYLSHTERMEARRDRVRIRRRKEAVRVIFYDSLMEYVSKRIPNDFTIAPRKGWRIAMYQPQQKTDPKLYTSTIDRNKLM